MGRENELQKRTSLIGAAAGGLLDLLYPKDLYCMCCGKIIDSSRLYRLCNDCMADIKWTGGRVCVKCGKNLSDTNPGERCFDCRERNHEFDRGFCCAEYGLHEKTLMYELKYASRSDIAETIGEIMLDRMLAEYTSDELASAYDAVVPVPIYRGRKGRRGFNQAEVIASSFARRAGIRCDAEVLRRTRETMPMKGLGPEERKANIKGAFELRERKRESINGSRLLIVDDIFTTGSTLDEAASVLKAAGASIVDFIVFASGADMIYS